MALAAVAAQRQRTWSGVTADFRLSLKNTFLDVQDRDDDDTDDEGLLAVRRQRSASVGDLARVRSRFPAACQAEALRPLPKTYASNFSSSSTSASAQDPRSPAATRRAAEWARRNTDTSAGSREASASTPRSLGREDYGRHALDVSRAPGGASSGDCAEPKDHEGEDLAWGDAPTPGAESTLSNGCSTNDEGKQTTLMLKGIPRSYTRKMVEQLLDEHGFAKQYDFLYLPLQFVTKANFGYAFLNLTTSQGVARFWQHFHWPRWRLDGEPTTVSWSSIRGGLDAHVEHFRNSPLMHPSMADEYKPVVFVDGVRCPFPAPTREIKKPRDRRSRLAQNFMTC
mmetsp:Transcript_97567/g.252503  ORF Transcript_97567/g.252503 Transcript_97567/m.252503 type:complete len:340 (+) Transcript_97567:109-1128(+)